MEHLSTILVLAVLVAVCVALAFHYKKNLKNGCCNCNSCDAKGCSLKKHETRVYIDGMKCSHCSASVEKAFSEAGYEASVNLEEKYALVYSFKPLDEQEISKMIEDLGFTFVKLM